MKGSKNKKEDINISDKASTGIANGILKSQRWFAETLDSLTNKWKRKHQRIFLFTVYILFGGLSVAAIVNSFVVPEYNKALIPKSITVPSGIFNQGRTLKITEREFQKVQEYKRKHPNLSMERPGLYDSLILIEQTYYSQKK